MKDVDVLVTPSFPFTAPRFDDRNQARYGAGFRFLAPFNLSGLPAMSVPCGFHSNGLPIGMQIVGNSFREDVVLSVGHAYQNATSWHKQKPDLDF
jgi:aspartyl-tRNA(Asn)/glutamyl-tRNA(Gln) amidotransferase subunit A